MGDRILRSLAVVALLAATAHADGRLTGKVTLTDADGKQAAADVIVYVVGFQETVDAKTPVATIAQQGRKFVPDLVAVTVGQGVVFPNNDPFLHNVFSQSPPRKFDLGSFKKGESKTKTFESAGVVDVYCNIHPEMAATILVLPNKRHTRAAANGTYTLEGIPAGTWTVFAYARRVAKPASAKVTVTDGGTATIDLSLVRGAEPPHVNKFGEKYKDPTTTYR